MFGMKVDMWSLGCVLAELFTGKLALFNGNDKQAVVAQVSLCFVIGRSFI